MTKKQRKIEYNELEQELDIESFRDHIFEYFQNVQDPRRQQNITFKVEHVFFIIIAALLAGANNISQISLFCSVKKNWLKKLLGCESLPCYGTIWWTLARIKPEAMRCMLQGWLQILPEDLRDKVLAIDGKHLCGTRDSKSGKSLHLVSLFAAESGFVLAQHPVEEKSNEITAIPEVLDSVDVTGAVITIDAMGCQKGIAKNIIDKGANYVLALKGNAGLIHDELCNFFEQAQAVGYEGVNHSVFSEEDRGHGRFVKRVVRSVTDLEWLPQAKDWGGLKSIIEIQSTRVVKNVTSTEKRYYISSMCVEAERLARIIRSHWAIENNLHRQLDVNFLEDDSTVNVGCAAENLAIFRRMVLNILGSGKGLSRRRKTASWDEGYLTDLVMNFFIKYF